MRLIVLDATADERRLLANFVQQSLPDANLVDGSGQIDVDGPLDGSQGATAADQNIQAAALFPIENPNPVLRIGRDGTVLFANRASERFLRAYGVTLHGPLPARWWQVLQEILADGKQRQIRVDVEDDVFELDCVPILGAGYVNVYGRNVTERVRIEEQLRESEEQARDLIRYAPTGIYEVDFPTGRFRAVNDAMCEILGYSREELLGMSAFEFLDDEGKALFAERMRRTLAGEEVDPAVDYRVKKRDGGVIYAVLSTRVTHRIGQPDGAFVIASDVTERRRAADALAEAANQLELRVRERTSELVLQAQRLEILHEIDQAILASRAPVEIAHAAVEQVQRVLRARRVAVALFDFATAEAEILAFAGLDSPQLPVNARWPLSAGWMIDEILAGRAATIVDIAALPDDDRWKAERLGQGVGSAAVLPMKAGDQVIGQLTIHRAESGALPPELMELALHVTDSLAIVVHNARLNEQLVQKQAALERANEALRYQATLLENINDAVIAYDDSLRITAWNRAAAEQYGWRAEEVLGADSSAVVRSQVSTEERAARLRTIAETGKWQGEIVHVRRDGTPIVVEATSMALRDETGRIFAHVTVNRDITERKRIDEELRASREHLQNLAHRLVELQENERYEVANQLYNDEGQRLAALLLGLGRLQREKHVDQAGAALLTEMIALADGVLSDMHSLAVNLRPAALDRLGLRAALEQAMTEFGRQAKVEVKCELAAIAVPALSAHVETNIFRIVQDALANIARHARANCVSLSAARQDGQLVLVLEDDGAGFDVEQARQAGSLGLLAMHERAEAMGGSLDIESLPGAGTTLYIRVPEPNS